MISTRAIALGLGMATILLTPMIVADVANNDIRMSGRIGHRYVDNYTAPPGCSAPSVSAPPPGSGLQQFTATITCSSRPCGLKAGDMQISLYVPSRVEAACGQAVNSCHPAAGTLTCQFSDSVTNLNPSDPVDVWTCTAYLAWNPEGTGTDIGFWFAHCGMASVTT